MRLKVTIIKSNKRESRRVRWIITEEEGRSLTQKQKQLLSLKVDQSFIYSDFITRRTIKAAKTYVYKHNLKSTKRYEVVNSIELGGLLIKRTK